MEANVTLDHVISEEELLRVYKIFCECYDIQIDRRDEERFLAWQYHRLIESGYLDHRPFMGAKFLGSGRNGNYGFHGYNENLPEQESRRIEFKTRIEKQFGRSS